jgi:hypothetical protein
MVTQRALRRRLLTLAFLLAFVPWCDEWENNTAATGAPNEPAAELG